MSHYINDDELDLIDELITRIGEVRAEMDALPTDISAEAWGFVARQHQRIVSYRVEQAQRAERWQQQREAEKTTAEVAS